MLVRTGLRLCAFPKRPIQAHPFFSARFLQTRGFSVTKCLPSKAPKEAHNTPSTVSFDIHSLPPLGSDSILAKRTFAELGLDTKLVDGLKQFPTPITKPTFIQNEAIPKILKSQEDICIADQTGTGKTLAYLLPIFQSLYNDEQSTQERPIGSRPKAIVLVPNRELGDQVASVAKHLAHHMRLKIRVASGGKSISTDDRDQLEEGVDILITTPSRLLQFLENRWIYLKWVKHFVVEEADVLFAKDFKTEIERLMLPIFSRVTNEKKTSQDLHKKTKGNLKLLREQHASAKSTDPALAEELLQKIAEQENKLTGNPPWSPKTKTTQFVFVVATLTPNLKEFIQTTFLDARTVQMETLHKPSKNLEHSFITVSLDKQEKLMACLKEDEHFKRRTMVFCNTMASCRSTGHFLAGSNIHASNFHGGVPPLQRADEYKKFKTGKTNVIICTDIASRGIDVPIDHVILFDFPMASADYIHRAGRTARAGAKGKVTSFIQKKDRELAEKIQSAIENGTPIEGVGEVAATKPPETPEEKEQKAKMQRYGAPLTASPELQVSRKNVPKNEKPRKHLTFDKKKTLENLPVIETMKPKRTTFNQHNEKSGEEPVAQERPPYKSRTSEPSKKPFKSDYSQHKKKSFSGSKDGWKKNPSETVKKTGGKPAVRAKKSSTASSKNTTRKPNRF